MKDNEKKATPIAVIGIGCLFPKAGTLTEYWSNIRERVDGITEVPASHWKPEDYFDADPKKPDMTYGRRGGFLSPVEFDSAEFGISPNNISATDPAQLLSLVAASQAMRDAGYGSERVFDKKRVSVILGVTGTLEIAIPLGARLGHPLWKKALKEHGIEGAEAESIVKRIADQYVGWQENSFPGLLGNVVAGRIANRLDLGGTNCVVDAACASSLSAAHLAGLELESGRSDMVVTGGVDTFNDIFMYMCFSKTPALSPTGNSKPFDAQGDGTILGEGIGMVVLKRLADAERDGDRIYAVLKGIGSSSDGRGKAIYAPSPEGQVQALKRAYENAGVTPDSIGMVEAHGTGTKVGDAAEVKALAEVYREAKAEGTWCALGSVKSQIGHTKAAAGSAGLIKAVLALHHKVLPPTIKIDKPLPELAAGETPFYANTEKRPWLSSSGTPRRAGVSAFGFGGSNFHAVLEEYQPEKRETDWDGNVQLAAFSADSLDTLKISVEAFPWTGTWDEIRVAAMRARETFSSARSLRLVAVLEKGKDLSQTLAAIRNGFAKNEAKSWSSPDGIYFGSGAPAGKLGVVFPGQGAQYVGMGRDLACAFPEALNVLANADAACGFKLSDLLYPFPAFDDAKRAEQEAELRATTAAQPGIGAMSLGAWRVLERFGVKAEAAAGHSYGELVALCAAGVFDETSLHDLSKLRGELMAAGGGDKGTMLAVLAPLADVERALAEEKLDLVLANKNAPKQAVLSGTKAEIARAMKALTQRGMKNTELPVAAAFHSSLVSDAKAPLRAALEKIDFKKPALPVYANTTGKPYPETPAAMRDLLGGQLAVPVEFVAEIAAMYADGVRTFLEVGPGARMSGLVKAILEGKEFETAAVDASGGKAAVAGKRAGIVDLARTLAKVAALGHAVDLKPWEDAEAGVRDVTGKKKAKIAVPVNGATPVGPAAKEFKQMQTITRRPSIEKQDAPSAAEPRRQEAAPAAAFAPAPSNANLRAGQEGLLALQRLQEQTALVHKQFLEGQETAQRALLALVQQQMQGGVVPMTAPIPEFRYEAPSPAPTPVSIPTPIVAPAPVVVAAAVAAKPASDLDVSAVERVLLAVVSEKTGYPAETLNLDMGMESDLGIDSIKRVEILSSLREKLPQAPVVGPQQIGTLRTLRQVIEFLTAGTPAVATTPAPAVSNNTAEVEQALLAVVSEKTGYPAETLNLDMGMESDLGIDSIKRVEILSSLREKLPQAPVVGPQHIGTLRTLRQVIEFLTAGTPAVVSAPAASPAAANSTADVEQALLAVVSEKTGYPAETLNLDMGMESDLGIDSIKRVEILSALREKLPQAPVVGPQHIGTLRTLRQVIEFLTAGNVEKPVAVPAVATATPQSAPAHDAKLKREVLTAAPFGGETRATVAISKKSLIWVADDGSALGESVVETLSGAGFKAKQVSFKELATLEAPSALAGLIVLAATSNAGDLFLKETFRFAKLAAPALRKSAEKGGAAFMTVSFLDGAFGLRGKSPDAAQGGLAGLAKTAAQEWPEVSCKALDVAPVMKDAAAASAIVAEFLLSGPLEVGVSAEGLCALKLEEKPFTPAAAALREGDIVLVTGGARGVTAETAIALAQAYKPSLILFGRTALEKEPAWLNGLTGEGEMKKAILANAGGKLAPKAIEEEFKRWSANREVARNLKRIEDAGSKVEYRTLDIRDAAAVKAEVAKVRAQGLVRGLIHGAGVLADRFILDKTAAQFDAVFDTKVAGLNNLLNALDVSELKALALFSSVSGRFGRAGQSDYAMANEVLNKCAHAFAAKQPSCKVVSIGWGPWDGGMVTPALKKAFEAEGAPVIPLEAGARFLVEELASGSRDIELVVTAAAKRESPATDSEMSVAFERVVDVATHPFLESHVIGGKAVLPLAVMGEWLAHAALHGNPGLRFHGLEDLRVFKGVILNGAPVRLRALASKAQPRGNAFVVAVELRGADAKNTLHAGARVLLSAKLPAFSGALLESAKGFYPRSANGAYQDVLFHGPAMRAIERVEACSPEGITAWVKAAPAPKAWMSQPLRSAWLSEPLAMDAAFQLAILWSHEIYKAGCLPNRAGSFLQYRNFPKDVLRIVARVKRHSPGSVIADIDFLDSEGLLVARLVDCESTIDASLNAAFRKNSIAAAV